MSTPSRRPSLERILPFGTLPVLATLLAQPALAASITVISTPAVLEPSSGSPGDKDGCPPVNSNADPEEAINEVHVSVTSTLVDPEIRVIDDNSPLGAWTRDFVDDLYLDEFSAVNGVTVGSGVRDLDYLDGVIDGQLAPGDYALYFNIEKVGYDQDELLGCAGLSVTTDHERYSYELLSSGLLVATASQVVAMEKSASISQNDLRWLDTEPESVEAAIGESFCFRSKYSWQSQQSAEQLVAQIYYWADVVRLDSFDFYYYDTNGADPGSILNGIPGVDVPGTPPSVTYHDQAYLQVSDLPGTQSSGDHYVGEYCFTVVGPGSSRFIPYFQSQVNRDRGTWKVDTGYPGWLSEPDAVVNPPELAVTKSCDASVTQVLEGESQDLTHTLEICNTGRGDAADTVLVDTLPADPRVTFVSASDGGTYDAAAGEVTWLVGDLATGTCVTRTVTVRAAAGAADGGGSIATNVGVAADAVSAVKDTYSVTASAAQSCSYPVTDVVPTASVDKSAVGFDDLDLDGLLGPGDLVHYQVTWANTGNVILASATLTDDPDEAWIDGVTAISGGGVYDGNTVSWALGDLAPGATGAFTYSTQLGGFGVFPAGTTAVDNVATLSSPALPSPIWDLETVGVVAAAGLTLSKIATGFTDVDGDGLLGPGDRVQYRIDWANPGNADATAAVIDDDPPEAYISAIGAISDGGAYDGDLVTWSLGTLPAGGAGSVTYEATLSGPGAFPHGVTSVQNLAIADSAEVGPVTATATVDVSAQVVLAIAKTVLGFEDVDLDGLLSPGDVVHYQVAWSDTGNASATSSFVSDDPDETYVSAVSDISGAGVYDGDLVRWDLGTVAPGAGGTLLYDATLAAGAFPEGTTEVANVAFFGSAEVAPVSAVATVDVSADVALGVAKVSTGYDDADSDGSLSPGDTVYYRVDFANDGNADALGIAVVDDPDEAFVAAVTGITGGGVYDGGTVTWSVGTLAAGQSGSFTYGAVLAGPGIFASGVTPVTNVAVLQSQGVDAAQATVTVDVTAAAALTVSKARTGTTDADGDGVPSPGDAVHYAVSYASTGNAPATGATVSDDPDEAFVASISAISGGGLYDGDRISWSLGTLAPGASGTLTYTATLAGPGAFAAGTTPVGNTATIASGETAPTTATATVDVTAAANLTVAKASTGSTDADGNGVLSPGDVVHYAVTYANSGNAPATGATVVDDPDEAFVASVSGISAGGLYDGDRISWSLGDVAPGAGGTLTYSATLAGAGTFAHGSTTVGNTATIDSADTDPVTASTGVDVTAAAALTVSKTSTGTTDADGNGVLSPGDSVHYAIAYANTGNAAATGATVSDDPDEAFVASISAITGGGLYDGDRISWSLGTVAPGASGTLTYTATLAGAGAFTDGTTPVGNTATIASGETPPTTATATVDVTAAASLTVAKASTGSTDVDGNGVLSPGDVVHYAVTYANSGNAPATGATVVDDPDEAFVASISGISAGGLYDGDRISWSLGDVAPGAGGTLTYSATLAGAGTFVHGSTTVGNTATIDSADTDPVTASVSVDVGAAADLSASKSSTGFTDADGNGVLSPGDSVHYAIAYANSGNAAATGATVSDDPDEAFVASISAVSGGGLYDGDRISWSLGTVAPGASGTLTYTATLAGAGAFTDGTTPVGNVATLVSGETPPTTTTATVDVTAAASLTLAKASTGSTDVDGNGVLSPGDVVHYAIAYANSGDAPATGATVVDDPDEAFVVSVSGISAGGLYDGDRISWSLGDVAPGAGGTLTYSATLKGAGTFAHGSTPVGNTATIDSADTEPVTASAGVDVAAAADLSASKTSTGTTDADGNGVLSPGDSVHYAIAYANTGNAAATGATVSDDPDEAFVASISAITGGGLYDGDRISWSLGTVAPGASGTLIYTATLAGPGAFAAGSTIVGNTAVIDSGETEPEPTSTDVTVTGTPALALAKTSTGFTDVDLDGVVSPGDVVHYALEYSNTGDAPATEVVLADDVADDYVASVDATASGGVYDGFSITWDLGTVAPGASGVLTYSATLEGPGTFPAGSTSVPNTATIDSADTGPTTDEEAVDVGASVALALSKVVTGTVDVDSDGLVSPGDQVTYRVDYANDGNSTAHDAILVDDPDEAYVSAVTGISGAGLWNGSTVVWTLGDLAPGASGSVTYTATLAAPGVFPAGTTAVGNTATLETAESLPIVASAAVDVTAAVALAATKSVTGTVDADGDGLVSPGDTVSYRVDWRNDGNATSSSTTLTDDPDQSWIASVGAISDLGTWDGDVLTWSLGDLAPGASGSVTYDVVLAPAGTFPHGLTAVSNSAVLASPDGAPASDTETVDVSAAAAVTLAKVLTTLEDFDGDGVASPGDRLGYRLDYSNTGNATATSVTVSDDPDEAYVVAVTGITGGGTYDGDQIAWSLPDLVPGASGSLAYTVQLAGPGAFTHGTVVVTNRATLRSTEGGDVPTSSEVPVTSAAALTLSKTSTDWADLDLDGLLGPGDTVEYRVDYANAGNATATAVELADDPDEAWVTAVIGITGGGLYDGDLILWTLGDVAPGATGSFSYTVVLADAGTFPDGVTPVVNVATLSSAELAPVGDTASVDVEAVATLSVVKVSTGFADLDLDGVLSPGDRVSYRVDVGSAGNATATAVTVTDDPDEAFVATVDAISHGGAYDGDVLSWSLGDLAPGATVSLTYDVFLAGPGAFADGNTAVSNTASASSPVALPAEASATVTVTASASLQVSKAMTGLVDADLDGVPSPGDTLTYGVSYSNPGNATATSATLADDPDETWISAVTDLLGGTYDGDVVTWDLGDVAPGAGGLVTYSVVLKAPGAFPAGTTPVLNQVVLASPDAGSVADSETVDVTAQPDLAITKALVATEAVEVSISNVATVVSNETAPRSSDPASATVAVSTRLTFRVHVDNGGNAAASGVVVTDPLPAGTRFVSADLGGVHDGGSGVVTWSVGSLAVGGTLDLTVVVETTH